MLIRHPSFAGLIQFGGIAALADHPDDRVAQTIQVMRRYAIEDSRTWPVQSILRTDPNPIQAAFQGAKDSLRYVTDDVLAAAFPSWNPVVEVLVRPRLSALGSAEGDCDDFSMLVASVLTAAGIPCRFVTVAADPEAPDQFSHVYVAAYAPDRIALDASHGAYPGWETPNRFGKIHEWSVQ